MKIKKLVLCLCLLLIGCASKPTTHAGAMHAFFKAFKTVNFTQMNELTSEPIDAKMQEDYLSFIEWTSFSQTKKEVYSILKEIDVTWILEYEDNQNATYFTTIKYYNLTELKENYLEYFIKAFEVHKDPVAYDTEIAKAYKTAYLHSVPSLEKTLRINLHKEGTTWWFNDSSSIFKDITTPIINQTYSVEY